MSTHTSRQEIQNKIDNIYRMLEDTRTGMLDWGDYERKQLKKDLAKIEKILDGWAT